MNGNNAMKITEAPVEREQEPRIASAEVLAEGRAITKNLSWDELVRIANKPKRAGWILWKASGAIEQITPLPSKDKLLARAWKTSLRHAFIRRPSESEYRCVELDPETKRPIASPGGNDDADCR